MIYTLHGFTAGVFTTSSHHDHHHIKICHPSEQYVDWGNNINYISMRDQNSPPYEQYVGWGNNINFIFIAT